MGHTDKPHPGVTTEGANSIHARHLYQSYTHRQTRDQEHLRVSSVQDTHTWSHLCVDVQHEDKGESCEMGHCWSVLAAECLTFLTSIRCLYTVVQDFMYVTCLYSSLCIEQCLAVLQKIFKVIMTVRQAIRCMILFSAATVVYS